MIKFMVEQRKYLLPGAFFIFFILAVSSLWRIQNDYNKKEKMSLLTMVLLLALFGFHAYTIIVTTGWIDYHRPPTPVTIPMITALGKASFYLGLAICAGGFLQLLLTRVFSGFNRSKLMTSGFYYFSRNPQVLGYALMIITFPLIWWSRSIAFWAILPLPFFHAWVILEEDHLERLYGDQYLNYKDRTPRYLGWIRKDRPT